MIFFLILLLISVSALAALLIRALLRQKAFTKEETLYHSARPFWNDFRDLFAAPAIRVQQENVRINVYKEIEKMARRFRIITLRLECLLMRFTEYIRGKRVMAANGHKPACRSHYWEQLNNCKNGTSNKEESKTP